MDTIGNMDMETQEPQTAKKMMDYVFTKPEPFLSIRNPLALLRMSFATRRFTLGFPTSLKNQSMTQQGSWERSSLNSKSSLPDMDEDEPWHEETIEEYK